MENRNYFFCSNLDVSTADITKSHDLTRIFQLKQKNRQNVINMINRIIADKDSLFSMPLAEKIFA